MMIWRVSGIALTLDDDEGCLGERVASDLSVPSGDIQLVDIIRRTIDARQNRPPRFVYVLRVRAHLPDGFLPQSKPGISVMPWKEIAPVPPLISVQAHSSPVVVAGSGPAGLFAAYELARHALPVILLERGRSVEKRIIDVERFWTDRVLDPASNVLFGEGGAGTFSDGKLTSRTKNPLASWIKTILVELGAPSDILTDAKPHIGTDRLRKVLVNLRKKLAEMGCDIRFDSRLTDIAVSEAGLAGVIVNDTEEIKTRHLVCAIGQGADDTYEALFRRGVAMQAKPFAMGLRVEHPQTLIDALQYGAWRSHPKLPPAEYFVTASLPDSGRSVYTFCMCPGGEVIGCAAFPGGVITNGMSNRLRSGRFANSAVVVNVRVEDFCWDGHPLAGLTFRRVWEEKAFLQGGGNYSAPAQRMVDFLRGDPSATIGPTSFRPGVRAADLGAALPGFVRDALRSGLVRINAKMPGFISEDVHLIGVETRTSSPVRIKRLENGQSETVSGVYPAGEGAGYAGGIISSALDGLGAARKLMAALD